MTYTRRNKGTCSRQTTVVIEDGILKDIRIEPVNFELVKEKILPLPSEWKRTENTVYKAFLWESLNSLNPLCNVAEF